MTGERSGRFTRLALPGLAVALGLAFLSRQAYTVERCFRMGTMSGCERPVYPFSLEALPSLALPALIVLLIAGLTWLVATSDLNEVVVAAATLSAAGVALLVLVGGVALVVPLALMLGVALRRLDRRPARAALDVALTAAICLTAAVAAYGVLVGAMYLRGGFLGGSAPLAAVYVAYGAVVGIGLGLARAARGDVVLPLASGMAVAAVAAGLAGTLALLLVPPVLGRGIIVAGVPLLAGLGITTGTAGARWLYGISWGSALALAVAVAVAFALFVGASLLLLFGFSGPLMLMPPLPAVPHLPGTSTN